MPKGSFQDRATWGAGYSKGMPWGSYDYMNPSADDIQQQGGGAQQSLQAMIEEMMRNMLSQQQGGMDVTPGQPTLARQTGAAGAAPLIDQTSPTPWGRPSQTPYDINRTYYTPSDQMQSP
jgi:hypothetical protein